MRLIAFPIAAAALLASAPCHAQDWLSGIARSAAQSAAQGLMNRAVSAVTNPSTPGATAQGAAAAPRAGGRPDRYDTNGDRIWRREDRGPERFDGKPVWQSAAQCAALNQLVDIHAADWRAHAASKNATYPEDRIESTRRIAVGAIERFRVFAVKRIQIDHPGADAQGQFDAEVARQVPILRQEDWSIHESWDRRHDQCDIFLEFQRGLIFDMEVGRGEGAKPAP